MIRRVIAVMMLAMVCGCAPTVPMLFNPATMEREVSRPDFRFTDFSILKWKVLQDTTDRDGHFYEAIVLARHDGQWALVHIAKNALTGRKRSAALGWGFGNVCHGGHKTLMCFKDVPTETELLAFERATWWSEKADPKFWLPTDTCTVVSSGVHRRNMERLTRRP